MFTDYSNCRVDVTDDKFLAIFNEDGEIQTINGRTKFNSLNEISQELNWYGLTMDQTNDNEIKVNPNIYRTRAIEAIAKNYFTEYDLERCLRNLQFTEKQFRLKSDGKRDAEKQVTLYLRAIVRQALGDLQSDANEHNEYLDQERFYSSRLLPMLLVQDTTYQKTSILIDKMSAGRRVLSISIRPDRFKSFTIPTARYAYPLMKLGRKWFFINSFEDIEKIDRMGDGFRTIEEARLFLADTWNRLITRFTRLMDNNPEKSCTDISKLMFIDERSPLMRSLTLYSGKMTDFDFKK